MFFSLRVEGRNNIPPTGGFIIASNHVSNLDPILLGVGTSPRPINFMAKEDLFKNRFFRWVLISVGAFPIKRNSGDIAAIKEAMRRLRNGFGLVIFPQGTRKQKREIDVQAGIGLLVSHTGVPVVPAYISGTDQALPVGAKWFCKANIRLAIGRPLTFEEGNSYPEVAHKVMQEINDLAPRG